MLKNIVYAEPGMYAGWPANHGAWQWGEEWLVGFLRGEYAQQSMHNIREPFDYCFARSLDDGATWTVEAHQREFEAGIVMHSPPEFSMSDTIRRVCGVYDHGGDETDPYGGFFLSHDRGRVWAGPFLFDGLREQFDGKRMHCTSRQCELPDDNLIFLSNAARYQWGTDRTFVARHDGRHFHFITYLDDGLARCVMPAVAKLPSGRIVVVCRRRKKSSCWIDAFRSDDQGKTWSEASFVEDTGSSNGNPPALIESRGLLYCAFGNRTDGTIRVLVSSNGLTWVGTPSTGTRIAQGIKSVSGYYDLGYPRLLKRADGVIACVYYIATEERPQQHIAMSLIV